MADLRISRRAERDFEEVGAWGAGEFGYFASAKHLAGFERLFGLLRTHPLIGQARPSWGKDLRTLSHRPHRILYRGTARLVLIVRIVRIVHMSRDVRQALRQNH